LYNLKESMAETIPIYFQFFFQNYRFVGFQIQAQLPRHFLQLC
jgi:hypothetical protein